MKDTEIKYCGKCKNGFIYINKIAYECDCIKNIKKELEIKRHINQKNLNLPENFDISLYNEEVDINKIKKIINFYKKYCGLYIYGKSCTKKTTFAKWIGQQFLLNNIKDVYYFSVYDFVKNYLLNFSEEKKEFTEKILKSSVLILDDFFDSKVKVINDTNYYNHIISFLVSRNNLNNFSIIVSNSSIEDLNISDDLKNHLLNKYIQIELKNSFIKKLTLKDIF